MRFAREEFDTMVQQLLYDDAVCFDMLCHIAEKTLRSTVSYWAQTDPCLKGRELEEDLMQEIQLKLMQHTVIDFLLNDRAEGAVNDDPEGFEDWMFAVARSRKADFVNAIRARDKKVYPLEDENRTEAPPDERELRQDRIDTLREALAVVLDADVGIYKVLTWLAQSIFILECNIPKIKTNDMIVDTFADKTLFQMYEMIRAASRKIPWLVITSAQDKRIRLALEESYGDGCCFGDVTYERFFMKQNGMVSGKKSISDWMNRMNNMIRRKMGAISATQTAKEKGAGE